jgi:glycerophosphoryl diester phosphodiesterase
MRRAFGFGVLGVVVIAALIWLNNTSLLASAPRHQPLLLAHRGLAQIYDSTGLTATTCTATRIHPPEHAFIENTLPSMRAALAAGANVVEFDVHPTTDGQFAMFHDWTLDCRTDGHGVTREHALADLKTLDVGFGYTADGGKTFPLRDTGIGLLPSLDEVLATFPDKRFLIHIKSNDPDEGRTLAARLRALPAEQLKHVMIYGGDRPVTAARDGLAATPTMSGASLKRCLLRYLLLGWSGYVPADCDRSVLLVPINYAGCGVGRTGFSTGWPGTIPKCLSSAATTARNFQRHRPTGGCRPARAGF